MWANRSLAGGCPIAVADSKPSGDGNARGIDLDPHGHFDRTVLCAVISIDDLRFGGAPRTLAWGQLSLGPESVSRRTFPVKIDVGQTADDRRRRGLGLPHLPSRVDHKCGDHRDDQAHNGRLSAMGLDHPDGTAFRPGVVHDWW